VRSLITLPGIYNSGPTHWQTLWEADGCMTRFAPRDWDAPQVDDWVTALDAAVAAAPEPPVLIAHSLACLLVPIWAARTDLAAAGAFLVAPVDPDEAAFPTTADEFRDFPRSPLPFPSLVVGSLNDHYATTAWAHTFAVDLGADFVVAGALGHINADSGLGDWPQGRMLLETILR
jgi:predicted alpha/beta hydrolase family esterase